MIVLDASVAALLFAQPGSDPRVKSARAAAARDPGWVVPEHWKTEVFSALRGLWLGRKLSDEQAHKALSRIPRMAVTVVPTDALLPRMWELRGNVSGYDAAYIAAAEVYDCPLVTADARLLRADRARCRIEVVS
ncbi:type II toxin-antitoxin system VapC family toxin [Streptomyces carpaticus]|uniref:Ribonuclease VapC n=1 Tax=Streptomyces harbinensis TaxID=1176198 RepID=A0A1I6S4U2_9ACTN|nr:type II toxin-antitoxin system VapC family toxin [Streptomyces harbinensis]UWM48458.1 type II toxin-antitoxin system VapC family toxin [Streptomyces carpaticus]SFS71956.1 Predicted nucleic acid-binding protein, contains PIN domain [Streptomyces harbinensis]